MSYKVKAALMFFGAWAVGMATLAGMAWILDGHPTSWRFFGYMAVAFTGVPIVVYLVSAGLRTKDSIQ